MRIYFSLPLEGGGTSLRVTERGLRFAPLSHRLVTALPKGELFCYPSKSLAERLSLSFVFRVVEAPTPTGYVCYPQIPFASRRGKNLGKPKITVGTGVLDCPLFLWITFILVGVGAFRRPVLTQIYLL